VRPVRILGAGPAGSAAAISALQHGVPVELIEKSRLPRHKVCGEFLSPEAAGILDRLGVWDSFAARCPAPIRRMALTVGNSVRSGVLPETAWGFSRYALDRLLYDHALASGGAAIRLNGAGERIDILASGRQNTAAPGRRLFGFKAHFEGPAEDAVELYFFDGCYAGVSPVEGGVTNVCALGPEPLLRRLRFDYDAVLDRSRPLAERLRPLTRAMEWLSVGPLVFGNVFRTWSDAGVYPAGDALSFVDPFTGSGIVAALSTGMLAGTAAATNVSVPEYLAGCRNALASPFRVAGILRSILRTGMADKLAPLVPASWLFRMTRPGASK
jgi:flavin-dependent dehydrogenase